MAKRRKSIRRGKRVSPVRSPADLRALRRLKKATDAAYKDFWLVALGIKPPRPPKIEPFFCLVGKTMDYLARSLPPLRPPL